MAHHFSRDITPLTNMFTENTDISLDSNRYMMLHELQKITQEMINIKVNLHRNEEKCKRLEVVNETHLQKQLDEMKEMKLYINELEMEKQRATDITEKQNKEIIELRTKIRGQETEISELKTKCCQMQTEIVTLKENVPTPNIINGLYEQMLNDFKSENWRRSIELMKRHLHNSSPAYKQLDNITDYINYPLLAARKGHIEIIQVMLDNDLPINKRYTSHKYTMLHEAVDYGQYNVVKFLIQQRADLNVRNLLGETALHRAALGGPLCLNIIELLVDGGADINVNDINGYTPLHRSVINGNKSVVEWLIKEGCNTTIRNKNNKTALDYAQTKELRDIIKIG